jgi:hypothetical protein
VFGWQTGYLKRPRCFFIWTGHQYVQVSRDFLRQGVGPFYIRPSFPDLHQCFPSTEISTSSFALSSFLFNMNELHGGCGCPAVFPHEETLWCLQTEVTHIASRFKILDTDSNVYCTHGCSVRYPSQASQHEQRINIENDASLKPSSCVLEDLQDTGTIRLELTEASKSVHQAHTRVYIYASFIHWFKGIEIFV